VKWDWIFELLNQILIDGFAALQDRPAILEALDLFKNETRCINLVFNGAVYRYDTFLCVLFGLPVRKYLNLGATWPLNNILDHVPLLADELCHVVGWNQQFNGVIDVFPVLAKHRVEDVYQHYDVGLDVFEPSVDD
jgi:hypothetical protein